MKEERPNNSRPIISYLVFVVIIMLLSNAFLFPRILNNQVEEVAYTTMLDMLENGKDGAKVVQASLDDENRTLVFMTENPTTTERRLYQTNIWPNDTTLLSRLTEAGVEISVEIPTQANPLISFLVSWLLPIVIFMALGQLILPRIMNGAGGQNVLSLGKSNAKIYIESQTGKTFADVAGQDEAKEALKEIVSYLHDGDCYKAIGAKLPKGALLVGPPGTGKTLLAKAVAWEAGVPFFSISGSEFVEMFVGMGAAKVRDLFKQATEKAPCIVFIDEIDTIGKKRDGAGGISGGNDEREQTLNQLLAEMDGFDAAKGVVILAATNRPEILDPALLRPGRFDRRIPVELPDLQGRIAILNVHAKDVRFEDHIDMAAIARATSGASGAELANIINEAALRAVREGRERVGQADLMESVETVIAGYQRKNAVISDREKRIIAYHEIGHALVAAKQKNAAPVTKITIIPRTSGALGYTMQVEEDEKVLMSREDAMIELTTLTGGRSAEEVVFGSVTSGASNDIEKATRLARAMITRYGMSKQFDMVALETVTNQYLGGDTSLACSAETSSLIDREVNDTIREAHEKALSILHDNRDKLDELAEYLLDRETITGEEFMAILNRPANLEGSEPPKLNA
ncbi:MAG: ATP-dependent zinc metalloprotease FtsH [Clostridia bacterium]|nr:ATP-dependent zinc metalloprotease FtsH [Clostridia bacterium]